MEKIIVLGNGGHAKSVVDAIEGQGKYSIAGYVVNDVTVNDDYPILGNDHDLQKIFDEGIRYAVLGIGYLGKGSLRQRLYQDLKKIGYSLPMICDPTSVISKKAIIDEGTFVGKGAIVNSGARIGKMCILNTGSIVEHDCEIGDFTHIAVGTVLCGDVKIGNNAFVGANATVIQGRRVGDRVIVGAGEMIKTDVEAGDVCNYRRVLVGGVTYNYLWMQIVDYKVRLYNRRCA